MHIKHPRSILVILHATTPAKPRQPRNVAINQLAPKNTPKYTNQHYRIWAIAIGWKDGLTIPIWDGMNAGTGNSSRDWSRLWGCFRVPGTGSEACPSRAISRRHHCGIFLFLVIMLECPSLALLALFGCFGEGGRNAPYTIIIFHMITKGATGTARDSLTLELPP